MLLPSGRILGRQCIWALPDHSKIFAYSISSTFALCSSGGHILTASLLREDRKFPQAAVYPVAIFMYVLFTVYSVAFSANVIWFGMDQLYDLPMNHQRLFIYWYVWLETLSSFIVSVSWSFITYSGELYWINHKYKFLMMCAISVLVFLSLTAFVLYLVSLCMGHFNHDWFLHDNCSIESFRACLPSD